MVQGYQMQLSTMMRVLLAAILFLIACGTLHAQTPAPVSDLRIEPNPTTIDVAATLRGRFNFGALVTVSSTVTRAGNTITVDHATHFIPVGTPPPPMPFNIPIGVLPEGVYTVVYQSRSTNFGGGSYAPLNLQLVVLGGTGVAVPSLLASSALLLVVLTLALGLWGFRRYR